MLLASCSSSSQWHHRHCRVQGGLGSQELTAWLAGQVWGAEPRVNWEGCQARLWQGDSSEGRVWPSDRDQDQTQPSDCQPVHGDEVRPRSSWAVSLWFRVQISEVHGLAQLQCNGKRSHLRVGQAGIGGHGLSWDGSQGQAWAGEASGEAGQGQQGHCCPPCPESSSPKRDLSSHPTEIWAQMGLAEECFNCCGV